MHDRALHRDANDLEERTPELARAERDRAHFEALKAIDRDRTESWLADFARNHRTRSHR
jgi:hypothetical protein